MAEDERRRRRRVGPPEAGTGEEVAVCAGLEYESSGEDGPDNNNNGRMIAKNKKKKTLDINMEREREIYHWCCGQGKKNPWRGSGREREMLG